MTKWISVEDSPPEHTKDVWVWPRLFARHAQKWHFLRDTTGWRNRVGDWYQTGKLATKKNRMEPPTYYAEIEWPEPPEEAK